ncbi:MAG: hypothetical protein IJM24_03925 [Clostridia bacterium]|nr:hypothetical protein [Clostridia bacterium]
MTELEIMQRAKMYLDKLANGIDPITGARVSETDCVRQARVSRCLSYVSEVLDKVIDNGGVAGKQKKSRKPPFSITPRELAAYRFDSEPIPVSEITGKINALVYSDDMLKLKYASITTFLIKAGLLAEEQSENGKPVKRPTEKGNALGIYLEEREGKYGTYHVILYDEDAQRFILKNMDLICEINKGNPVFVDALTEIKVKSPTVLSYEDFIVYSHAFRCLNNHDTETVNVVVQIARPNGDIIEKTVKAAYCSTCDKYIILNADYESLKNYGVLLCRQQSFEKFIESESDNSKYRDWKDASDLRLLGYTVNAKDDLSEEQRRVILCTAIESGLYTVESLRSFLLLLVRANDDKPNYSRAVSRWKSDIEYLSNYDANFRTVGAKSFTKTTYHKT